MEEADRMNAELKELLREDIKALKAYAEMLTGKITISNRAKLETISNIAEGIIERLDTVAGYEAVRNNEVIKKMLENEDLETEKNEDPGNQYI